MKRYNCNSCGKDWYSSGGGKECDDCGGKLKEIKDWMVNNEGSIVNTGIRDWFGACRG